MTRVVIIGDGPGGLSAALFLAKNDIETTVLGKDKTAMHFAHLHNYLGIPEISGTEFQEIARAQASAFGARLLDEEATAVAVGESITVTSDNGEHQSDYLILTEGKTPELARSLGLVGDDGAVPVDADYRSTLDRVYVLGRTVRPTRSQAIISAGAGAVAALDILAREAGVDIQDWDTPPSTP